MYLEQVQPGYPAAQYLFSHILIQILLYLAGLDLGSIEITMIWYKFCPFHV